MLGTLLAVAALFQGPATTDSAMALRAFADYSWRAFEAMAPPGMERNAFVSPLSLGMGLGALAGGTAGSSRDEILGLLVGGMPLRALDAMIPSINGVGATDGVTVEIGNSVWVREGFAISPAFERRMREVFAAATGMTDLSSPQGLETINGWVDSVTHGMIPILLEEPLPREAVVALLNALYFKGTWRYPFPAEKTKPLEFTRADGSRVVVPIMWSLRNRLYGWWPQGQIVRLPYDGERIAAYVVVPAGDVTLEQLRTGLDGDRWKEWLRTLREERVSVLLPRFRLEHSLDLKPALESLQVRAIFDPRKADFTPLAARPAMARGVYLGTAIQRAVVEVNEEGTDAAAATMFSPFVTSPPIIDATRPFLFVIYDDALGLPLFIGTVYDPVESH